MNSRSLDLSKALSKIWMNAPPQVSSKGGETAAELERRYCVQLPQDFRDYLAYAAPAEDWMDEGQIVYWAPGRMWSLSDELNGYNGHRTLPVEILAECDQYIMFADYLDWCGYAYAICCSNGQNRGKVVMIGSEGVPDHFVASSLTSFIILAGTASDRLHWPGGQGYTDGI